VSDSPVRYRVTESKRGLESAGGILAGSSGRSHPQDGQDPNAVPMSQERFG
jgi:hypothetical protein